MFCTPHHVLFRRSNKKEWDWQGMWHEWGIQELRTGFWWGDVMEGDHLEDVGVDGTIILK